MAEGSARTIPVCPAVRTTPSEGSSGHAETESHLQEWRVVAKCQSVNRLAYRTMAEEEHLVAEERRIRQR